MKLLKTLFNFYLNASIHVAFAVYAFIRITEYYYQLSYDENFNYLIFFGTITGYNFVKYAGVAKLHHKSLTNDLKIIQIFSFICFLVTCYYAYLVPLSTLLFCVPFGILTVLYAVPFLSGFHKSLRQISYLKIMVVALVWAFFTVTIPYFNVKSEITFSIILSTIQRFLFVIVLILPFDIRDVKYDAISLQTIPKKIGVPKTKRLGLLLMVICLVLEYVIPSEIGTQTPFMIFFFCAVLFLMRSKINQPNYYSSFFVESLPIVWWLLILGFHNF